MASSKNNVWYFAYGSNMETDVMQRRGMAVLETKRLRIPTHVLTFDIFGIPYNEPAMASIAPREASLQDPADARPPAVHGIGYLLSEAGLQKLVVSEGAGTAYQEVDPVAETLSDEKEGGEVVTVRTLVSRYPFRPNPLPSQRYLELAAPRGKGAQLANSISRLSCKSPDIPQESIPDRKNRLSAVSWLLDADRELVDEADQALTWQ
ncbi:hypothetical protein BST61_g4409 [Cercospora zeina]